MTIDRAISEYQTWVESDYSPDLRPHFNAIRLAFEALKRVKELRRFEGISHQKLLPGETEE